MKVICRDERWEKRGGGNDEAIERSSRFSACPFLVGLEWIHRVLHHVFVIRPPRQITIPLLFWAGKVTLILLVIEKQNYRASVRAEMEGRRENVAWTSWMVWVTRDGLRNDWSKTSSANEGWAQGGNYNEGMIHREVNEYGSAWMARVIKVWTGGETNWVIGRWSKKRRQWWMRERWRHKEGKETLRKCHFCLIFH